VSSSHVTSTGSRSSVGSRSFLRSPPRRHQLRHWLAGLPLVAVAVLTFNGPAPAGMSNEAGAPAAVAPPAQPAPHWSADNLRALLSLVEQSAAEGLDPAYYQPSTLRQLVDAGRVGEDVDQVAYRTALALAHDYADGRVADKQALGWYMAAPADPEKLGVQLDHALADGRLAEWMRGLLPSHPQYLALKAAYRSTAPQDGALRDRLRANLERWRWMPRDLGQRYIYVNVPSYRLQLVSDGAEEASFNVVVGAPETPTPQLAVRAQSIVANPSWVLPPSVLKEGRWGGRGFSVSRRSDGSLMVRQAPGPRNALGRIKIDMPNAHAIYLHDTPNKAAFKREERALSHGCIRVQNIEELAALIEDSGKIEEALADPTQTRTLQLDQSIPVYLAYFTVEASQDGMLTELGDPYDRDTALLARLDKPGGGENLAAL